MCLSGWAREVRKGGGDAEVGTTSLQKSQPLWDP